MIYFGATILLKTEIDLFSCRKKIPIEFFSGVGNTKNKRMRKGSEYRIFNTVKPV